jgi:hypothetical protein
MNFSIEKSIEILERTPTVIESLLAGLSTDWLHATEGENTWCPLEIVGHFIYAEKALWIPRMELILSDSPDRTFPAFDRFAELRESWLRSVPELVAEFRDLRQKNIAILKSKKDLENQLGRTAIHPQFGEVTLQQLLSTWTVHDFTHLSQMIRVMAKQYKEEVGPWIANLKVLKQ